MSAQMCRRLGVVAGRRCTLWSGILGWWAGAPSPVTCPTRSGACSQEARMAMVRHCTHSNQKAQQAVCNAYWQLSVCATVSGTHSLKIPPDVLACQAASCRSVRLHAPLDSILTSRDILSIGTYTALQLHMSTDSCIDSCMLHFSLHWCALPLGHCWGPIMNTSLSVYRCALIVVVVVCVCRPSHQWLSLIHI